jgi:broad specificity phosphatase PhoE
MAAKEIFIIRHGQTEHNRKGIVQGKGVNLALNETGEKQAKKFYDAYKDFEFDVVYTSTLLRAQQSVKLFIDKGIQHEVRASLDEISWGEFEGNASIMEQSEEFKKLVDSWSAGFLDEKPTGGESSIELQMRQMPFIEEVLQSHFKKILVCMHGRAMRALLCSFTNAPLTKMMDFEHSNLTLYKLYLNENGVFEIELFNDTKHLDA